MVDDLRAQRCLELAELDSGRRLELRDLLGVQLLDLLDRRRSRFSSSTLGHEVGREVEHPLQVARRDIEQQAKSARRALHVPDVRDRRGQLDVAHALAANLGACHFDAALVADGAGVADSLVLAAIALPVLGRTEDALAEQAAVLRLQRSVVDGLRLGNLAVRPGPDRLRRCQADPDRVEIVDIKHAAAVLPVVPGVPAVRVLADCGRNAELRCRKSMPLCARHISSDIESGWR